MSTQWRITYTNTNPAPERGRTDHVTPLGDGRYQHQLHAHAHSQIDAFRNGAERTGATDIHIQHRTVQHTTTYGPWQDSDNNPAGPSTAESAYSSPGPKTTQTLAVLHHSANYLRELHTEHQWLAQLPDPEIAILLLEHHDLNQRGASTDAVAQFWLGWQHFAERCGGWV